MTHPTHPIRRLREESELDVETLASFAGLAPERLQAIEEGGHAEASTLDSLAALFGMELSDLFQLHPEPPPAALLFRSRDELGAELPLWAAHNAARLGSFLRCVRRLHRLEETSSDALEQLGIPPSQAAADATERGMALAARTRAALGLDATAPIPSMLKLMERLGVALFALNDIDEDPLPGLDAACTRWPRPAILLNLNSSMSPWWRVRMTLAHELAHLLLDHQTPSGGNLPFLISPHGRRDSTPLAYMERRANAFAANLIAPPDGVRATLAPLDDPTSEEAIRRITHTFGVGREVAIRRIGDVLYPGQTTIQEIMEARGNPLRHAMPTWPHNTFPPEECGLPGGPLRRLVLKRYKRRRISAIEARALLDVPLTAWIDPGEGLSDAQRKPLRTPRDEVRQATLRILREHDLGTAWSAGQLEETPQGWRVHLLRSTYGSPPAPQGTILLSRTLELASPLPVPGAANTGR